MSDGQHRRRLTNKEYHGRTIPRNSRNKIIYLYTKQLAYCPLVRHSVWKTSVLFVFFFDGLILWYEQLILIRNV